MVRFLGFILFIFSFSAGAAYLPQADSITVGGRVFTDLTNLKVLIGNVPTTGNVTTLRSGSATSGYTPSGATVFRVRAVRLVPSKNTTASATFLYGNTDVGVNSASLPTTPIYYGGGGSTDYQIISPGPSAAGTTGTSVAEMAVDFTIPNAKYPAVLVTGAGVLYMYGYEE